jgi:hypothetical protein
MNKHFLLLFSLFYFIVGEFQSLLPEERASVVGSRELKGFSMCRTMSM